MTQFCHQLALLQCRLVIKPPNTRVLKLAHFLLYPESVTFSLASNGGGRLNQKQSPLHLLSLYKQAKKFIEGLRV